ncbi:hypothetical protein C5167_017212 [Papaver somniferum]|uniref:Pectinesterase n=1 Tax=Papaver somniferum TaxID=3469 RepID=A0A4Y7IL01_PAPSO|nr:pectinesterase-like [Papaver somniferum]RZC48786.1 hypothetical protein C5167_017212 [Papaver somniferum]
MMNKVAAASVSLILVVGVVIGCVIGFGHRSTGHQEEVKNEVSAGMKAVETLCGPTDYKDACVRSLTPLANNGTTDPKELIKGAIQVIAGEVQKAAEQSVALANDAKNSNNATLKAALESCKGYLDYAISDIEESITALGESQITSISDLTPELKNWLSAVISLKESCLDNLDDNSELKDTMHKGLLNTTELTVNALAIVDEIAGILKTFNIPIDLNITSSTSRKLLSTETDKDGYPYWFSDDSRRVLAAQGFGNLKPNAVVAKDGSGQFKTIAEALAAYPKNQPRSAKYVVYVKAGVYDEYITVTKEQHNVFMYGDGPTKTVVTGKKNVALDGYKTDKSATFAVEGRHFVAKSMGFENTAGPEGHQAVALRVNADRCAFFDCSITAYQDTLYIQSHRQFYRDCTISGTVDFIFGDSATVIQNSKIIARKPMDNQFNAVTAHGRSQARETTGVVIQNCDIIAEPELLPVSSKIQSFLGRPWKEYSKAIFLENRIDGFIHPDGYTPWQGTFALDTLYYGEYANTGAGADTSKRVNWKGFHVIKDRAEALSYTVAPFLTAPRWLKETGIPYTVGLKA